MCRIVWAKKKNEKWNEYSTLYRRYLHLDIAWKHSDLCIDGRAIGQGDWNWGDIENFAWVLAWVQGNVATMVFFLSTEN